MRKAGYSDRPADISALIVLSALSVLVKLVLMWRAHRREAAVGRQELKALFGVSADDFAVSRLLDRLFDLAKMLGDIWVTDRVSDLGG